MGKIFTVFFLLIIINVSGQTTAPKLINYQGVARDNNGVVITNAFDIRFIITSPSSTLHFETQTGIQPNQFGVFNTQIGSVTTLTPSTWNNGPFTLQVLIKTGSTFDAVGSQQLVSVPFALFAGDVATSYTNNILTIGANSYNLSSNVTPTINGTGLVTVTPNTGPLYAVDVPTPALSYVQAGNVLTLTQGTAVTTTTLTGSGSSTVSMVATGVASVNPASGNSFTINVPQTIPNFSGNTLILNQGAAVNSAVFNPTLSGDVNGSITTATVTALQNFPISTTAPTNNQLLSFISGSWTPITPAAAPVGPWQKIGNNVTLITTSDNVGIGVATPIAKLDVAGSPTTTSNIFKVVNTNTSNTSPVATINSNGSGDVLTVTQTGAAANAGNFSSTNGQAIFATSSSSVGHVIDALSNNTSTLSYAGFFDGGVFVRGKTNTASGYAVNIQNSSTDIFGIRNDGFTGIGDMNPTSKLHVSGTNNGTFANAFSASPETAIRIHNDDITNNNFSSLIFSTKAANLSNYEGAKIVGAFTDHTNVSGDLVFFTRNPTNLFERMRITSAGRVGIGTSTPAGPLDVVGEIITDSLQLTSPTIPTAGAVLTARDAAGNTKWMAATAFKGAFVPQSPITIGTAVQTNIGNTLGGYSSSILLNTSPAGFGVSFLSTGVRFIPPETGIYELESAIMVAINSSASGNLYVAFEIFNQTTATVLVRSMQSNPDNTNTVNTVMQVSTTSLLTKGDIIILRISGSLANTGTISNTYPATDKINYFSGHLIR